MYSTWGHCIAFLEETLYSHSASPKSGVKMDSDAGGSPVMVLQAFSGEHYNILALNLFRNNYFEHSFSLFFFNFLDVHDPTRFLISKFLGKMSKVD